VLRRFIASFGDERFVAMDAHRSGIVSVVLARSFVKAMSPAANDAQVRLAKPLAQHVHTNRLWLARDVGQDAHCLLRCSSFRLHVWRWCIHSITHQLLVHAAQQ
jgi:hypothetical protein